MDFNRELDFEEALINLLFEKGWEHEVLKYKTEKDLIDNWAKILFDNNRDIDRLGDYPLTDGEMRQIIEEQINVLKTPLNLNGFINGKSTSIIRDNPDDTLHFGKSVTLKIYDRDEIAAGQSRYQIAEQPKFKVQHPLASERRGDFMLLINGMPVIHVELKKSGVSVSQACNQIEKYAHEGVFSQGLFSLVQVFVAMEPKETVYFANPGPDGIFNSAFYFHWADFNNEPVNDWEQIATDLLSIPMAHQLIGFYTVADKSDGLLKVMRSYQYNAANKVSDRVAKIKWGEGDTKGGYIWHTTGSGKTLTSFKSAQLIANSKDADKVVFLLDRIELGNQSFIDYKNFAEDDEAIQATENTRILITKLKSDKKENTLIVTSIQKMSRIKEEGVFNDADIEKINKKRVVFIIDEAHRSTFGEMLVTIKQTFPNAVFFGFTGTPIQEENQKRMNTTATIFGNELHKYTISHGIRDKNVLGFDPYKVLTFDDMDVRKAVALDKAKVETEQEAISDPAKKAVYYKYINDVPMVGFVDDSGRYHSGIEDYIPTVQYVTDKHQKAVVKDIVKGWVTLSCNSKFHAIFATSSINEAITYYSLLKDAAPQLNIAALFDPTIDNNGGSTVKEDAILKMLEDYNAMFGKGFKMANYDAYKQDIALRLAHKDPYLGIENDPRENLNILIVVDQMLTGFDSKWINTLYLDKELENEHIIQAFSRTNRIFGPDKPHGTIRYYRRPHTMEKKIDAAVELYSWGRPYGVFVERLEKNLGKINSLYNEIKSLFDAAGIDNFERLPADKPSRIQFARLFKTLNDYLEAARIQGFDWGKKTYDFTHESGPVTHVTMLLDHDTYLILALRYKELFVPGSGGDEDVPYDLDSHLTAINTAAINTDYMNSRFDKFLLVLNSDEELKKKALDELHKTFATLSQEEQKYANIFLHDVQSGKATVQKGKTLRDYITDYIKQAENDRIHRFAEKLGIDETKLRELMTIRTSVTDINEYGRFDALIDGADKTVAKVYFDAIEPSPVPMRKVKMKLDAITRKFIADGGFDI